MSCVPQLLIDTEVNGEECRARFWVVENYVPFDLYPYCKTLPLFEKPKIMVYGKECTQRRNVGFFSDDSRGYKYSGQIMPATSFANHPWLKQLMEQVNIALSTSFNGVLVNSYVTGEDHLGAHSDDEKGLDKGPRKIVAGISCGVTRTFRIRDKATKKIVLDYPHKSGTLIVMENMQSMFLHEIPPQKRIKPGPHEDLNNPDILDKYTRISLTFRNHTE